MATYVLIPGAGDTAWSWSFVAAELRDRAHDAVAVDLPCDDRVFPAEFARRLARERLGIEADERHGSHSAYLSRPQELAARLDAYRAAR